MPTGQMGGLTTATEVAVARSVAEPARREEEPHTITISRVLNGYIVHVGCQIVVFETKAKMLKELGRYLDSPQAVAKEYLKIANR